eukprot:c10053_g1_i1.p2 GENE.c10053_g1_i1~~c10053_g1_i1.p2  ORF type:complete len:110 (-),score=27.45 c10053_g1_i1:249-578(-)
MRPVITMQWLQHLMMFAVPTVAVFLFVGRKTQAPREETLASDAVAHNKRLLAHRNDPEKMEAMNRILFAHNKDELKDKFLPNIPEPEKRVFKGEERFSKTMTSNKPTDE